MADDPTRSAALRAAGIGATVDTQDPPGKVTVVFDLADFDTLISKLVDGDPADVNTARAEGVEEGRAAAASVAALNARTQLVRELVSDRAAGKDLAAVVADLARQTGVPTDPRPIDRNDPARKALIGSGPSTGPMKKGRLRP